MDRKDKFEIELAVKKAAEISRVPEKLIHGLLGNIPSLFSLGVENLLHKSIIFSRWSLAGSITGTFTILVSWNDFYEFYPKLVIKTFLVLQLLSIVSGLLYLLKAEVKEALEKSVEAKIKELKESFDAILMENPNIISDLKKNKDKTLVDSFDDAFEKIAKHLVSATFLWGQLFFLSIGLILLIVSALMK